jgi:hypothetical protein
MLDKTCASDGRGFSPMIAIRKMLFLKNHNIEDHLASKRHGTWEVIFFLNMLIPLRRDDGKHFPRYYVIGCPITKRFSSDTRSVSGKNRLFHHRY